MRGVIRTVAVIAVAMMAAGCANIVRGKDQQVQINTYDTRSNKLVVADCVVSNDEGTFHTKSNRAVAVGRDKDLLKIECKTEDLAGSKMVDGEINLGYFAVDLLLLPFIISGPIDGVTGAWAQYPPMIDVPMDPRR